MAAGIRPVGSLTTDEVAAALASAAAASWPGQHHDWRYHCTPSAIELHTEASWDGPVIGPVARRLRLAGGATLCNLRLALRAMGVQPIVSLLPDTTQPYLLARVQPVGQRPVDPADRILAGAIDGGVAHPVRFAPSSLVAGLRAAARAEQVWLATLDQVQSRTFEEFVRGVGSSRRDEPGTPGCTNRDTGIDAEAAAAGSPLGTDHRRRPLVAVVGSFDDQPLAHLHAGQATQRVVLTATAAGLPPSHVSQIVDAPDTRRWLRHLIGDGLWPQAVLRFDHGPTTTGSTLPSTT